MKPVLYAASVTFASIALSAQAVSGAPISASDYYGVRSVIQYGGGGIIDSLNENDQTSDAQQYNNAPTALQSNISIADGTLGSLVDVTGGSSYGFVNNQFGDTVTFSNGQNSNVEISLDVDGIVDIEAATQNLNSYQGTSVTARLALFDATAGATLDTWFDMSFGSGPITALDTDIFQYSVNNNFQDVFEQIAESLQVSTILTSNSQDLRVFAQLDLVGIRNSNPGQTSLDFLNTAQLGITTSPGTTFTSSSGVLLQGPPVSAVPVPAAGWLLFASFGALAAARRRKS